MPRKPLAKDVRPETRVAIAIFLAAKSVGGVFPHGAVKKAAEWFALSRWTISRVWSMRARPASMILPRKPRSHTPTKLSPLEVAELVQAIPLCLRQTIRSLTAATGIPPATLARHLAKKTIRRVITRVKPTLSDEHKKRRLAFALAHVEKPLGTYCTFDFALSIDIGYCLKVLLRIL